MVPFDDAGEEAAKVPEAHPDGGGCQRAPVSTSGASSEPGFEGFDVGSSDVGSRGDVGVSGDLTNWAKSRRVVSIVTTLPGRSSRTSRTASGSSRRFACSPIEFETRHQPIMAATRIQAAHARSPGQSRACAREEQSQAGTNPRCSARKKRCGEEHHPSVNRRLHSTANRVDRGQWAVDHKFAGGPYRPAWRRTRAPGSPDVCVADGSRAPPSVRTHPGQWTLEHGERARFVPTSARTSRAELTCLAVSSRCSRLAVP